MGAHAAPGALPGPSRRSEGAKLWATDPQRRRKRRGAPGSGRAHCSPRRARTSVKRITHGGCHHGAASPLSPRTPYGGRSASAAGRLSGVGPRPVRRKGDRTGRRARARLARRVQRSVQGALRASREAVPLYIQVRNRLHIWQAIGAPDKVLRAIRQGARVPFHTQPAPFHEGVSRFDGAQAAFMAAERDRLVELGAWERVTFKSNLALAEFNKKSFISKAFLVPKPGSAKLRLVIDLRHLNTFCVPGGCKYETLKELGRLAQPNDWLFSFDLQDGYHAISINKKDRKYFTFQMSLDGGAVETYRIAVLSFGWLLSPLHFVQAMQPVVRAIRSPELLGRLPPQLAARLAPLRVGVRVLPYVDDFLFLLPGSLSLAQAREVRNAVAFLFDLLGLKRHEEKGVWEPCKRLTHLGLDVDTSRGLFLVPPAKASRLAGFAKLPIS